MAEVGWTAARGGVMTFYPLAWVLEWWNMYSFSLNNILAFRTADTTQTRAFVEGVNKSKINDLP